MKLSKEEQNNLRKKIRGIIKTKLKNIKYSLDYENVFKPTKLHNDIVIGPGMTSGQNLSPAPSTNMV